MWISILALKSDSCQVSAEDLRLFIRLLKLRLFNTNVYFVDLFGLSSSLSVVFTLLALFFPPCTRENGLEMSYRIIATELKQVFCKLKLFLASMQGSLVLEGC